MFLRSCGTNSIPTLYFGKDLTVRGVAATYSFGDYIISSKDANVPVVHWSRIPGR